MFLSCLQLPIVCWCPGVPAAAGTPGFWEPYAWGL